MEKTMDKIVALAKARGFVYPGSEIYGGLANTWDYGNLGVELKNNVKRAWWQKFVMENPYNVGVDCAILMNPQTWVASGHLGGFSDPLMDCKECHERFRADKLIEDYCEEKGITVIEGAASNTSEVQEAAQNLAAKCDAVFSPNDNTIAGAMGTVTEVMNKAKVPMFVGADSMVMDGGLGTVGIEYSDLGKETANMAAQILSGEKKASEIPIKVFNEDLSTYINKTTADTIGITIPDDIANGEKTVYFD